jgi:hypothetical protein
VVKKRNYPLRVRVKFKKQEKTNENKKNRITSPADFADVVVYAATGAYRM